MAFLYLRFAVLFCLSLNPDRISYIIMSEMVTSSLTEIILVMWLNCYCCHSRGYTQGNLHGLLFRIHFEMVVPHMLSGFGYSFSFTTCGLNERGSGHTQEPELFCSVGFVLEKGQRGFAD